MIQYSAFLIALAASYTLLSGCTDQKTAPNVTQKRINEVTHRALQNLVFIDGGTFMLGDVGVLSGRAYTTLDDDNKPPVEVSLDSYSISKYETTWGQFLVYLREVNRADVYTPDSDFKSARILPITANNDPLSYRQIWCMAIKQRSCLIDPQPPLHPGTRRC